MSETEVTWEVRMEGFEDQGYELASEDEAMRIARVCSEGDHTAAGITHYVTRVERTLTKTFCGKPKTRRKAS